MHDAILNARYVDETFGEQFTITDVSADGYEIGDEIDPDEPAADDEIVLTVEYEELGEITITLEQFRETSSIHLVDIPSDA